MDEIVLLLDKLDIHVDYPKMTVWLRENEMVSIRENIESMEEAYKRGYKKGNDEGYRDGFDEGFEIGNTEGFREGQREGIPQKWEH